MQRLIYREYTLVHECGSECLTYYRISYEELYLKYAASELGDVRLAFSCWRYEASRRYARWHEEFNAASSISGTDISGLHSVSIAYSHSVGFAINNRPSIVTTGNTCSPSWDQISLSETPQQNLDDISKLYNLIFPYSLCPPTLFFSTIQISQLRASASTVLFSGTMDPAHSLEAQDLLTEIESFIPEDWAQPGEHYEEWLQVGTIYQSAVALYCTMAFQSLTILPSTLEMNAMRCIHGDRLLANLRIAMETPRLVKFMMWPMVVAGVEAGYRGEATQYWIAKQLSELSRLLGTSSPLKAEAVLRRYWQKEEKGWDECFDRPYVFVV
jgi:hypothetical protein